MKTMTERDPMTRRVSEVMHKGILSCDRDASLREVARTMAEKRVHCVVVESGSGDAGPLWGVVSGLDLVTAAVLAGLAWACTLFVIGEASTALMIGVVPVWLFQAIMPIAFLLMILHTVEEDPPAATAVAAGTIR